MRSFIRFLSLASPLILLAGCIPSLQPFYTDPDVVFEEKLLGDWSGENEKESWTFSKADAAKVYSVKYVDQDGKEGPFVAHLFKLDDRMYLDFFPDDPELKQNSFYAIHLLPAHTLMRVNLDGDTLKMAVMNGDAIKKMIETDPAAIRHEKLDNTSVLSASTAELQAWIRKEGDKLFSDDPMELKRKAAKE